MSVACRGCGSRQLEEVLDLGRLPLAGDFRPLGETNILYPLAVDVCERCGLLQVREMVEHSVIFNPSYSYASSTVPGLVRHFQDYAKDVAIPSGQARRRLLEVGCNDGIFLEPLKQHGYDVVGIDASENVASMAKNRNLDVHAGTFGVKAAESLLRRYGLFDVVTCSNVFAHNPQLVDFVEGVTHLLEPTAGELWIEVHSAQGLREGVQWDCFYHEHCFYWSIHSLQKVLRGFGFNLRRYQTTAMHGGALRVVFWKGPTQCEPQEPELTVADWRQFRGEALRSRDTIRAALSYLPIRYAYGAAGRAVTLINWTGIAERLAFVVDGSPLRYGRAIPNTRVPVVSESEYFHRSEVNDWCFVTAHNYLAGIAEKVKARLPDRAIRFVTPLPHLLIQ